MSQLVREQQPQKQPVHGTGMNAMLSLMPKPQPSPTPNPNDVNAKKHAENQQARASSSQNTLKSKSPIPQPKPKPVNAPWLDDVNELNPQVQTLANTIKAPRPAPTAKRLEQQQQNVLTITNTQFDAQRAPENQINSNVTAHGNKRVDVKLGATAGDVNQLFNPNRPMTSLDLQNIKQVMGHIKEMQDNGQCGPVEVAGNPQAVQAAQRIAGEMNVQTVQYQQQQSSSFMQGLQQQGYQVTPQTCAQEAQNDQQSQSSPFKLSPVSIQCGG